MKYIKTYEKLIEYPNTTDKQYWIFLNDFDIDDLTIKTILKFRELLDGDFIFDGINLTNYTELTIGDKTEPFELEPTGIRHFQNNNKLRLATPEEIELRLERVKEKNTSKI